jgi:UDP-N-acetylmuramyl pentapeptide phosphotransferase/UDP-N-acetylglucosamine-1-phosphate transferase
VVVVAVVNAVNFMDGINGISAVTGAVAGAAFAWLGAELDDRTLLVLGAAVAGASLAFLPWNAPRARVFLGDVGSYGLGAALAAGVCLALAAGSTPEAAVGPLALYLADTGTVLCAGGAPVSRSARRTASTPTSGSPTRG